MKKLISILSLSALAIVAAIGVLTFALPSNQLNISFPRDSNAAHAPGSSDGHDHPDAPALAATAEDEQITISWQTVADAAAYEIWARHGAEPWAQVDGGTLTSASTSFTHTGLTAGATYFYTARSVNASGVKSTWSQQAQATVNAAIVAPVLKAVAGANQVAVSWPTVTGAATYELWAWETNEDWEQIDDGSLTATSFNHSGLTAGKSYYYQGRAVSATGAFGPWSEQVAATVLANLAAPVLTATAAVGQITLTWQAVTDAAGYEIWFHQTGTEWQKADDGSLTGSSTSFTHAGLTGGLTYYYHGRALTPAGAAGPWSLPVHATVLVPLAAPALTLTPGHAHIDLSWQAVPGADTYELWTWQEGADWVQLGSGPLTATSFEHDNLTVGSKHYYAVRAHSDEGVESEWSEYVGAIAAGELPTPVLTATASGAQITITWQHIPGANFYELWFWVEGADWTQLGGGNLTATTFTHSGLTAGATYYYQLRAHANDGKQSAWSENADATP